MRIKFNLCLSLLFFYLTLLSCKKDKIEISSTPEIRLIEVTPNPIREYKDKVVFNIYYRDGDGDLGENNDAVKNLFITDSRNNIMYQYRIKQLAPNDANVAIEGNLMVELNSVALLNGSNSQEVTYSIVLKDRAGNSSNTVTTAALSIIK